MVPQAGRARRIVFEGLPGAGKTSAATWLACRLGALSVREWVVDERWARSRSRALPHYLENDLRKEEAARAARAPFVIMDRHYHGALAFTCAMSVSPKELHPPGESVAQNRRLYESALRLGRLTPPELLIILDIPPTLSLRRQPRAKAAEVLFGDLRALQAMRAHYLNAHDSPVVVVLDATQPRLRVLERICALVQ